MVRILGPHGQRLWVTARKNGGKHNGVGGIWSIHACHRRPNWCGFYDGSGNKICRESHPGGGKNDADGGKVRRNILHGVHAATTTAPMLPTTPLTHNIPNTTETTPGKNRYTADPTPTAGLPANNKKEGQMQKRPMQRNWVQPILEPRRPKILSVGRTTYRRI